MNNATSDEKILSGWATWALLQSAYGPAGEERELARGFCVDRLLKLVGEHGVGDVKPGPRSFIVTTACWRWGRGVTPQDAALAAVKAGAGRTVKAFVHLVLNDATPEVNSAGYVIANSDSAVITIGPVARLGALIVEKPKKTKTT